MKQTSFSQSDYEFESIIIDNISFSTINDSQIHGRGLFATQIINKNTLIGWLDGQIMPWTHYDAITSKLKDNIKHVSCYFFMEWNALDSSTLLVRPFRTKYSFINHSRGPNTIICYNPIRVITLETIEAGQEILLDYRKEPLRKEYLTGHGKTYL